MRLLKVELIVMIFMIMIIILIMTFTGIVHGNKFNLTMKFDYLCKQNQTCVFNFNSTNSTMIVPSIRGSPV